MNINILKLSIICFIAFSCQEKGKTTKKETNSNTISESTEKKKVSEKDTITIEYLYKYNSYDYETKLSNGYNIEFSY